MRSPAAVTQSSPAETDLRSEKPTVVDLHNHCGTSPENEVTCPAGPPEPSLSERLAQGGDLRPGDPVGEYRIDGRLGQGGFGSVFRATHPLIGKVAAIKVLRQQFSRDPDMVSRFIAEARAVNQIRHRNIVDIFAFGMLEDGRLYYVMELVEGVSLDCYLRKKGRLAIAEALTLLTQVARALDAAHAQGIAHRDLKTENIQVTFEETGALFPKLLDFGVAKLLDGTAVHKTRTGVPLGTPCYMSPEQCRGLLIDHRTDIYSFGVLTFEVLTGQLPFTADTVMDMLIKHTSEQPPKPSSVCPELPAALDAPILAMLEKDPERRPNSVGAAIRSLAAAAEMRLTPASAPLAVPLCPSDPGSSPAETDRVMLSPTLSPESTGSAQRQTTRPKLWRVLVACAALALVFGLQRVSSSPRLGSALMPALWKLPQALSNLPSEPVTPVQSASVPDTIALTIQSDPPGVQVLRGEEELGVAPGPIQLPRSKDKIKLTCKAQGYKTAEVAVTPQADGVLSVVLTRVPPTQSPPRSRSRELENPF